MIRPLHPLPKQGDDPVTPFIATVEGRPFRVLIDRPTIIKGEALQVLDVFATIPAIECWSTTDNSERWVKIDWETEVNDHIAVRLHAPGRLTHVALNPASTWRIFAEHISTAELPVQEVLRQLGCAEVCARHRFDMIVSDSAALLREPVGIGGRINIRSATDAVAHLSLFLRSRGSYVLGTIAPTSKAASGSTWWLLVPSSQLPTVGSPPARSARATAKTC